MIAQSIPFPGGWSAAQQNTPNPPGMQGRVSLSCWIILALVYIPSRNRVEGSGRHAVRFCLEMRGGALGQGGGVGAGPRRIASGKVRETDWPANFLQRNARGGDSGGIGSNGPVSGDCVVRRKVLDERSSRWKAVPLKKWPGEGHTGLRVAETVPEAVEDMLEGACSRVYVGEGRHSWDGSRLIVGGWRAEERCPEEGTYPRGEDAEHTLAVGGDLHARMWGMWVLEPHARGEFAGVTLAHAAAPGPSEPTFQVWHGPWVFQDCDLRSTCGVALQGIMRADISCVGCSIGGLDAGERDEYGDWVGTTDYVSGDESRAVFGVSLADLAAADLVMCTVEYTGLVHAACMSLASSTLRLNSCLVHSNSIGVYMDDSAAVQVASCTFSDNDMGAFYSGVASSDSTAVLLNNSVHGKLWYNQRRPGSLEETFNIPEGGAATHTNESLSEMLDRLARDRSDGLDLDLSERFDKETALPPFPSSTSRIGKASLCSLSHLYGMARLEKGRLPNVDQDPTYEKYYQDYVERWSGNPSPLHLGKKPSSLDDIEQTVSRFLMPMRLEMMRIMEECGDEIEQEEDSSEVRLKQAFEDEQDVMEELKEEFGDEVLCDLPPELVGQGVVGGAMSLPHQQVRANVGP